MTMNALISKKKIRASHTKSKNGCRTCKTRRVKCDESRPSCKNCCSTGRKCDGYGIWNAVSIPATTTRETTPPGISIYPQHGTDIPQGTCNMTVLVTLPKLNNEERLCFDYFRFKTIIKIPGGFYSYFWQNLVLQACISEPAVLHAAIALGSAHRIDDESLRFRWIRGKSHDVKEIGRCEVFTIQEYLKAISHLRNRNTEDSCAPLRVVLITCVLFVTLDLLRGEYGNAQTHTASGWKMMKELRACNTSDSTAQSEADISSDYTLVDESLSESLACLNVQSALFGCKTATAHLDISHPAHLSEVKIPPSFRNMSEARRSFNVVLGDVIALTQNCRSFDFSGTPYPPDLRTRQTCLQTAIASWKVAYSRSGEALTRQTDAMNTTVGVHLLRVLLSMTSIMAQTALSGGRQMLFDDYTSHFTSIITQTLSILNGKVKAQSNAQAHTAGTPKSAEHLAGDFIADVGILPFTYYTALKCRVPWLRRQAVALLLATPLREGMWDNFIMANVAKRVIKLEENGFYDSFAEEIKPGPYDNPVDNNERLKHIPPLPESSRFYDVELQMYDPLKGTGKLILRRRKNVGEGGWEEVSSNFDFSGLKEEPTTVCDYSSPGMGGISGSSGGLSAAN
ncbi:hypothetical protein BKA65DRAFT_491923 [Rhexocercosporidium sp. MPI-PUGE-AT-0058]|nr:hypothetical protein BKA65DRAFT_491923 [Rhexocercosporidium sp. MPI-PUGE-AT-0058]